MRRGAGGKGRCVTGRKEYRVRHLTFRLAAGSRGVNATEGLSGTPRLNRQLPAALDRPAPVI
jgi:hypothetical protein